MPSIRDAFLNGLAQIRGMRRQSRLPAGWQSPAVDPPDSYELVPDPTPLPGPGEAESLLREWDTKGLPRLDPEADAQVRQEALAARTPEELDAVIRGPEPYRTPYEKRWEEATPADVLIPAALRTAGGLAGGLSKVGGPVGMAIGGVLGAGGEGWAQTYETLRGLREPDSMKALKGLAVEGGLGAIIPTWLRKVPVNRPVATVAAHAASGAAMSGVGGELYRRSQDMPSDNVDRAIDALIGAAGGAGFGVHSYIKGQPKQGVYAGQSRDLVPFQERPANFQEGEIIPDQAQLGAGPRQIPGTAPRQIERGSIPLGGDVQEGWGPTRPGDEPRGPRPGARIVPPGTPVRPYRWGEYPDLGDSEAIGLLEQLAGAAENGAIPLRGRVADPETVVGPSPVEPPPTPGRVPMRGDQVSEPDPQLRQAFIDAVMRGDMDLANQLGAQIGQRADLDRRFFQIPPQVEPAAPVAPTVLQLQRPIDVMGRRVGAVEFDVENGMVALIFGPEPNQRLRIPPAQYGAMRQAVPGLPEPPAVNRPAPRDRFDIFAPEDRDLVRQRTEAVEGELIDDQGQARIDFQGPRRLPQDAQADVVSQLARELGLELPVPAETRVRSQRAGRPAAQTGLALSPIEALRPGPAVGTPVPTSFAIPDAPQPPINPFAATPRPSAPAPLQEAPPPPATVQPPSPPVAPQEPPAAPHDPVFEALYQRAVREGFPGTREELAEAKRLADSFNESMRDANSTAADPVALLKRVAHYGGLDDDPNWLGETSWLWESSTAHVPGRMKKSGKMGRSRRMPIGGIKGVPGVMRKGGLTVDHLREVIAQEPEFAHLAQLGDQDFIDLLTEAAGRERQKTGQVALTGNWWEPFMPIKPTALGDVAGMDVDALIDEFNAGLPRYDAGEMAGEEAARFEAVQDRINALMAEEAGVTPATAAPPAASEPPAIAAAPPAPQKRIDLGPAYDKWQAHREEIARRQRELAKMLGVDPGGVTRVPEPPPAPEPPPPADLVPRTEETVLDTELQGAVELGQWKEFKARELGMLADALEINLTDLKRLLKDGVMTDDPRVIRWLNDVTVLREPELAPELERMRRGNGGGGGTPPPPPGAEAVPVPLPPEPEPLADLVGREQAAPVVPEVPILDPTQPGARVRARHGKGPAEPGIVRQVVQTDKGPRYRVQLDDGMESHYNADELTLAGEKPPVAEASPEEAQDILQQLAAAGDKAEAAAVVPPAELDRLLARARDQMLNGKTAKARADAKVNYDALTKLKAREASGGVEGSQGPYGQKPAETPTGELEGLLFNTEKKPDLFAPPSAEDLADAAPVEFAPLDRPALVRLLDELEAAIDRSKRSGTVGGQRLRTLQAEAQMVREQLAQLGPKAAEAPSKALTLRDLDESLQEKLVNGLGYMEQAQENLRAAVTTASERARANATLGRGRTMVEEALAEIRNEHGQDVADQMYREAQNWGKEPDAPAAAPEDLGDLVGVEPLVSKPAPTKTATPAQLEKPATTYEQLAGNRQGFLRHQLKFSIDEINAMTVEEANALGERARTEGIEAVRNPKWQRPRFEQAKNDQGQWVVRDNQDGSLSEPLRTRALAEAQADQRNRNAAAPPPAAPAEPRVPAAKRQTAPESLEELLQGYGEKDLPRKLEAIKERQARAQRVGAQEKFPANRYEDVEAGKPAVVPPRPLEAPAVVQRKAGAPQAPQEPVQRGRVDPRVAGTNPRMNDKRAARMQELINNPSKENLDEYAKFLLAQAERENAIQLRGGTGKEPKGDVKWGEDMPHGKFDEATGEYLGSGLGGLQALYERNPEAWSALIRGGFGAIAGATTADEGDDKYLRALVGFAAGAGMTSKVRGGAYRTAGKIGYKFAPDAIDKARASRLAKTLAENVPAFKEIADATDEIAKQWRPLQAKVEAGGLYPVRWPRNPARDFSVLDSLRQPHAVQNELFHEVFPEFVAMNEAEAEFPSVTPAHAAYTRQRYLGESIAHIRQQATKARDAGRPNEAAYLSAWANQLAGVPGPVSRLLSQLTTGRWSPKQIERGFSEISNHIYRTMIGFAIDTALVNRGQVLLNAPQIGARNTLKGVAKSRTEAGQAETEFLKYHQMPEREDDLAGPQGSLVKSTRAFDRLAHFYMQAGDNANRQGGYLAARDYAREKGLNAGDAHKFALDMTFQTQGLPGAIGQNPFLRMLGPLRALANYTTTFAELAYDYATHPNPVVSAKALGSILGMKALTALAGVSFLSLFVPRTWSITGPAKDAAVDVWKHGEEALGGAKAGHTLMDDLAGLAVPRYPRKVFNIARERIGSSGLGPRPIYDRYAQQVDERSLTEDLGDLLGVDFTGPEQRREENSRAYQFERDVQNRRRAERSQRYGELREGLRTGDTERATEALRRMTPQQRKAWLKNRRLDVQGRVRQRLPRDERQRFDQEFNQEQP